MKGAAKTTAELPKVLEDIAIAFGLDGEKVVMNQFHQERVASIDGIPVNYDFLGRIKEVGGKLVQYRSGDEAEGAKQVGDKPIFHTGLGVKPDQYDRSYFSGDNSRK